MKNQGKRVFVSVMLIVALLAAPLAHAAGITLRVNGEIAGDSVQPVNVKGTVLVPLRFVAQLFDAATNWDQEAKAATVTKNGKTITITLGKTDATVSTEGETRAVKLAQPAQLVTNSIMLPIRFLSDELGADIAWDASTSTVNIRTEGGTDTGGEPNNICTAWRFNPLTGNGELYTRVC
ncbi:copper amine oxidase N-terminal domain-containing protein [Paenibacillus sp. 1P07SE]|uniref:copper amine oxidase N-terminal domain-containing protein n=1 Tax=Paenibacillus sp. 1P07SE TaxID=3132209 RepID=UPI0039A6EBED